MLSKEFHNFKFSVHEKSPDSASEEFSKKRVLGGDEVKEFPNIKSTDSAVCTVKNFLLKVA